MAVTLVSNLRIPGYIKYIGNESHGKGDGDEWIDRYYYEVPEDVAPGLIAKGAWREKDADRESVCER